MARNPTNWSNNDVKPPANWSGVAKGVANWANNVTKLPAAFIQSTKSKASWGINSQAAQTYFYNDTNLAYNDPNLQYNYILNGNQLNQDLVTRWGQVV